MLKSIARLVLSCVVLLFIGSVAAFAKGNKKYFHKKMPDNFEKDIIYGHNMNWSGADQSVGMDIYWPANAEKGKKYPFVLLVHGGSFLNGRKEGLAKACQALADSGFVAGTIDYRMGWNRNSGNKACDADLAGLMRAVYRANQDTRAAMRYVVDNADKYHVDKNWLFIGGGSAGGVTALDVVYLTQDYMNKTDPKIEQELGKLDEVTNPSKTKYKIKGICNMWGALPDSSLVTASSAVPTIFFHGTADKVVPYDHGVWGSTCPNSPQLFGSACIYRRLQVYGKPGLLNLVIGGKHGPDEYTHEQMMSNTACFFHSVIKGTAHSGEYNDVIKGCR